MRIAQISTVSAPVGPQSGGSVEALVWLLTRELVRMGHEVTVFGTAHSQCDGALVPSLPGPYGAQGSLDDWYLCEWVTLGKALEQADRFDVMHSHAYLWGIPLQHLVPNPLLHTLHVVPDDNAAGLWRRWPRSIVTAISTHQWSAYPDLNPLAVIPHGVDADQFEFNDSPEDYLCYLGRFTSGKGPLHAIETARRLELPLVLAGPENPYFREKIKPLIDGRRVKYAGYVQGEKRARLLGGARALLYPIQFAEAFGLVLPEAMLCGTPVAAIDLGAVAEIIEEGVSGCIAPTAKDFTPAVQRALLLDRHKVRASAENRFSPRTMAEAYVSAYENSLQLPLADPS